LIASSLDLKLFQNILRWISNRKKFQISLLEIIYSFIVHLRSKKAKKVYY